MQLEGRDIIFDLNPVDGAKKVFLLGKISRKLLRDAINSPLINQLQQGSPKRFYSKNTIRYFDLVTSFDVNLRRINQNTILGDHLFLQVNNFNVNYPQFNNISVNRLYSTSLGELFIGHQYYFLIYIKIGNLTIPAQKVYWSEFISGDFEILLNLLEYRSYFDDMMQSEISVVAEMRESYTFNDNPVASLIYQFDEPVYVDPPLISSKSFENSIEIKLQEDPRADKSDIYRFSSLNQDPKLVELDCDNNICTDININGGVLYSYYAISQSGSNVSLESNVANGMPTTEYKFDYINYDPAVSAYSQRSVTGRVLNVFTDLPVDLSDVEVTLSIPDLGIVYPSVTIDSNGEFRVEARIGENSIFRELEQEVVKADDDGRNLSISTVSINTNVINQSGSISGTIGLRNDGEVAESNGRLAIELRSQNGIVKESSTINFSLSSGSTRNQSFNIPISEQTTIGEYQLMIEVTNSEGLDENSIENIKYEDIYIYDNLFSSPTYKLEHFEFDTVGSIINTSSGILELTGISSSGRVKFEFKSDNTGFINVDEDMNEFWESGDQDLLLVPTYSNINTGEVEVYVVV